MIEKFGIGIDIVNIQEFEKIPYKTKSSFYKKIFLPEEIKYCLNHKNPYINFAGRFALKEAVIKAIKEDIPMIKIKTSHFKSKPTINLLTENSYKFIASLTHESNFAIAVVVSESVKQ